MNAVDRFVEAFAIDPGSRRASAWSAGATHSLVGSEPRDFTEFMERAAHDSFAQGLLHCLLPDAQPDLIAWNAPQGWRSDWPGTPRLVAWAYDWLGRLWCFDLDHRVKGEPMIVRLEPGRAEWSDTDLRFSEFIGREIVDWRDDWLSETFYRDWLGQGGQATQAGQCIGYRVPPLLGGSEDDMANLELSDLVVHVSVCGQVASQAADLEPGTVIDRVTLD